MNTPPNPTPLPPAFARSEAVRNLWCPQYSHCLDLAVRQGWHDWTCVHCEQSRVELTPSATSYAHNRPRE